LKQNMIRPYANSREYLSAELAWLDLLIHCEVLRWRETVPDKFHNELKGFYISDQEIDSLIVNNREELQKDNNDSYKLLIEAAASRAKHISLRKEMSIKHGILLPLHQLAQLFSLTSFEEQVILICLSPEVDGKYEKLYAYLQDDVTQKRPGVDLVMRLLCVTLENRIEARRIFSHQATLLRFQILRYEGSDDNLQTGRLLKLEESVINFLLEIRQLSKKTSAYAHLMIPQYNLHSLRWPETLKSRLVSLTIGHLQNVHKSQRRLLFHFYGSKGTGKKTLASALCQEMGMSFLVVDLQEILLSNQGLESALNAIFLEGILRPFAIYLEHFDKLIGDDDKAVSYCKHIAGCVDKFLWLTFIGTEKAWEPSGLFKEHVFISIELPIPDLTMASRLWPLLINGQGITLSCHGLNWPELTARFRLTPGQMQDALITARNYACLREGKEAQLLAEDLYMGCRAQSNQKLSTLAKKLVSSRNWSDITLPKNALQQLSEICAHVKHRQKVFLEWGFKKIVSLGKGLCALFYGPSGTGKTLAAEIIANDLRLEVYKIDLSTVVSKYIGETEKNLSKIFHEAETSNAILFFDEADALFGKRSEVKDAHDRYANIEINYLLQRMEEFEGIAILATNFKKNIDDAFFRRMHFAVEFPFPDAESRYRIWKHHFPDSAPLDNNIDFDFLASHFNITGGNIKNIAVNAAFLAVDDSGAIHMEHIILATYREYKKMGRMSTETDFGRYHSLLKEL